MQCMLAVVWGACEHCGLWSLSKPAGLQVMMVPTFKGWPSDQITVSFWMWSLDACRPGVPISYARCAPDVKGCSPRLLISLLPRLQCHATCRAAGSRAECWHT